MANSIIFKLVGTHHALGVLLVLEATLVVPNALVPLLILRWEGAKIASCAACSAYYLRPDLYMKDRCAGVATL